MISGVAYCLFGMWMVVWNHWILGWALFFFIGNTIYFKIFEERGLLRRFGDEYSKYRKKTPMWLPRFK
jgi:protein-S-isoprenylcysteine O-methyltransferase Ste14